MSSKTNPAEQKEIPEVIKDEGRAPAQIRKYERGRFLGKVMIFEKSVYLPGILRKMVVAPKHLLGYNIYLL